MPTTNQIVARLVYAHEVAQTVGVQTSQATRTADLVTTPAVVDVSPGTAVETGLFSATAERTLSVDVEVADG